MELSWFMKLRIAAVAAVGVILVGIFAKWMAAPSGSVSDINYGGAAALVILAFLAGLIGYFVSWPYGRQIGILAAPFGLTVWAISADSMASLMQFRPTVAQRQELLAQIKWEPIFWLVVVAAGFAGVLLAQKIHPCPGLKQEQEKSGSKLTDYFNGLVAFVGSALIAHFCIRIFAQDVEVLDSRFGSVVAQPAAGQIAFAVLVSFGLAAFVVKKFLAADYFWPILASALVTAFAASMYARQDDLQYIIRTWPAAFFSNSVVCVLPVQMVAFGTLGSVAGYWLAIRYDYWRKHET
jgi:hypothetical protein